MRMRGSDGHNYTRQESPSKILFTTFSDKPEIVNEGFRKSGQTCEICCYLNITPVETN